MVDGILNSAYIHEELEGGEETKEEGVKSHLITTPPPPPA